MKRGLEVNYRLLIVIISGLFIVFGFDKLAELSITLNNRYQDEFQGLIFNLLSFVLFSIILILFVILIMFIRRLFKHLSNPYVAFDNLSQVWVVSLLAIILFMFSYGLGVLGRSPIFVQILISITLANVFVNVISSLGLLFLLIILSAQD